MIFPQENCGKRQLPVRCPHDTPAPARPPPRSHRAVRVPLRPAPDGQDHLPESTVPAIAAVQPAAGEVFLRLSREPGRLRAELATVDPASGPVIIDEIQKLPGLLDEVHDLIESRGLRFVLAASNPAKLRRGGVNLLGGRARTRGLFPFVSAEVPDWDLMRAVNVGGIPSIYYSDDPIEDLRAYCGTYLQMEIQAEGLVRGVERFSRFLTAAALTCGEQVVFDRVAADAAVPPRTVREYFQVLEDTLLGSLLQPYRPRRPRRKPASHEALSVRCRRRQCSCGHDTSRGRKPRIRPSPGTARLLRAARLPRLQPIPGRLDLLAYHGWLRGRLRHRRRRGDRGQGHRRGDPPRPHRPAADRRRDAAAETHRRLHRIGRAHRRRHRDPAGTGVPACPLEQRPHREPCAHTGAPMPNR